MKVKEKEKEEECVDLSEMRVSQRPLRLWVSDDDAYSRQDLGKKIKRIQTVKSVSMVTTSLIFDSSMNTPP